MLCFRLVCLSADSLEADLGKHMLFCNLGVKQPRLGLGIQQQPSWYLARCPSCQCEVQTKYFDFFAPSGSYMSHGLCSGLDPTFTILSQCVPFPEEASLRSLLIYESINYPR